MTDDWQPAETAPRDGSLFLVLDPNEAIYDARFVHRRGRFEAQHPEAGPHPIGFSHWRPRPALPDRSIAG